MKWRDRFMAIFCALSCPLFGQSFATPAGNYQRLFSQSTAEVEKVVKNLLPASAGRLPILDGFAMAGERGLERYQRAYYQCTARVSAATPGRTLVQVSANITAWYADADPSKSGYRVLASNGRLESDFLDRLQDALATNGNTTVPTNPKSDPTSSSKVAESAPTISAPMPGGSLLSDAIASTKTPMSTPARPNAISGNADSEASPRTRKAVSDRHIEELTKQAKNLEEILHNQSQPNNLIAVKESGTPVLAAPNEEAAVLFAAAAEDEFEILDLNPSWVHVRISGLSRGWIRRSSVEVPEGFGLPTKPAQPDAAPAPSTQAAPFYVQSEQTASFPGDWPPLRGKTVTIISVQKTNVAASSSERKLEFAKTLFERKYDELKQSSGSTEGVVLIFDSADGGMAAAPLPLIQQWKAGTLSDEGFWRRCYLDPPEMFASSHQ